MVQRKILADRVGPDVMLTKICDVDRATRDLFRLLWRNRTRGRIHVRVFAKHQQHDEL